MAVPAKCFLVSGSPGLGKTTLISKILETLKSSNPNLKIQGFFTREIRQGGERVGFEVVTLDGRTAPLASINTSSAESIRWPTVGRYKVDVASFESLALPELQVKEDTDLFVIDEVGKKTLAFVCDNALEVKKALHATVDSLFAVHPSITIDSSSTDQIESTEVKPTLLWSALYIQDLIEGLMGPVVMTQTPDGNLNYNDLLHATSKLYHKLYPDDEFFPETSNTLV